MWFEEIKNLESISNIQKIQKIKNSLDNIKPIDNINLEKIKDIQERSDLENAIKNIIQDGESSLLGFMVPQDMLNSITNLIVNNIWRKFDELTTWAATSFNDFFKQNLSLVTWIFNNGFNHEELQIRNFVDTVYSVGYSFDNVNGNYEVIDELWNIVSLWNKLAVINGATVNWIESEDKREILDDILLERSFTGKWTNIQEMVSILREVWINPENENQIDSLSPKQLGEAYVKYYAKKLQYSWNIDINNSTSIITFLNDSNVKGKIPIERTTYIKLLINGQFDQNEWTDDTLVYKKIMKEFDSITKGTGNDLEGLKRFWNWANNVLKNWVSGISEYINGVEWIILMWAAIWALFFSDFKSTAWKAIAGFAWWNVLVKAFNEDKNSGILQEISWLIEWWAEYDIILPESLKTLDSKLSLNDTKQINTIAALSSMQMEDILENLEENDGSYYFKDTTKIPTKQRQILEQLWGKEKYKLEVNNALWKVFDRLRKNGEDFITMKQRLMAEYVDNNYNASFSLVLASEIIHQSNTLNSSTATNPWIAPVTSTTNPINTVTTAPSINLALKPNNAEMQQYQSILSTYSGSDKTSILIMLKNSTKNHSIQFLASITNPSSEITNLINNLRP